MQSKDSKIVIIILIILVIGFIVWYYYKSHNESKDTSGNNPPIITQTIEIVQENSDASFYPAFVSGKDNKIRYNSSEFSYNPSTNTLSAGTFKGNLSGSASNIEVQALPDVVIQPKTEGYHQTGYYGIERYSEQPKQGRFGVVPSPNGEYFISLTSGDSGSQDVRATSNLKYDNTNNVIMGKVQNIAGGSPGSIVYQSNDGQTTFLNSTSANDGQILVFDSESNSPKWFDSTSISFGSAASAKNIEGGDKGQILYQYGNGQTTSLSVPSSISDPYLSFGANGEPTWASLSSTNTNAGTVTVTSL